MEPGFEPEGQREFLHRLVGLIRDLIHKVEEFEPEHITEEDVIAIGYPTTTSLLQQAVERDKLAQELVDTIMKDHEAGDTITVGTLTIANLLKEKLNATR